MRGMGSWAADWHGLNLPERTRGRRSWQRLRWGQGNGQQREGGGEGRVGMQTRSSEGEEGGRGRTQRHTRSTLLAGGMRLSPPCKKSFVSTPYGRSDSMLFRCT